MKSNETEQQFLKLAKTIQMDARVPDERVPDGFQAQVMARVREQHALEIRSSDEQFLRFARNLPANEHVPYAFEKRIMARLRDLLTPDPLTLWSRMLWRAVGPCLGVMILVVLFSSEGLVDSSAGQAAGELAFVTADFVTVVLASFDDLENTW